jgi:hypothetical protein
MLRCFCSVSDVQEDKECFELVSYLKSNAPSYIDTAVIDAYVKQQTSNTSDQSQVRGSGGEGGRLYFS